MAAIFRLFAVSSLCILVLSLSFGPSTALAHTIKRDTIRAHDSIIKRKRELRRRRCKAKGLTQPTATATTSTSTSSPTSTTHTKPQSTTSHKPTATPAKPKPAAQDSSKKVGLAWANPDNSQIQFWAQPSVGHLYTWSPYCPPEAQQNGISCCPQLWGYKSVSQFQSLVTPDYANCALGPNEPNLSSQSNISPSDAATLWRQNMDPLANHGYYLVSPACTNGQDGMDWMVSFMKECSDCTINAVALHYYGTSGDDFISWVTSFHNAWGLPIWVTEVACQNFGSGGQCTEDSTKAFLDQITGWMQSTSWVEAYFWFGVLHDMAGVNQDNQLIQTNGQPNSLGWDYLSG